MFLLEVFAKKTDIAYLNDMKTAYIETHYREGYHFDMKDQLVDEIYSLIFSCNPLLSSVYPTSSPFKQTA